MSADRPSPAARQGSTSSLAQSGDKEKKRGLGVSFGTEVASTSGTGSSPSRVRIADGGGSSPEKSSAAERLAALGARPSTASSGGASGLSSLLKGGSSAGAAATLQSLAASAGKDADGHRLSTGSSGTQRWSVARSGVFAYRSLGGISTSFFLEKQAVVLDFGSAWTKVGFATEASPRRILATPELGLGHKCSSSMSTTLMEAEWVEILDKLIQKIFFHYLMVSPKDRRVVVCEPVFAPRQFRDALAFCLFKRYSVPFVSFVVDMVMPLYLTGLHTGVVIDVGHTSSRVLPTFAGVPVISAHRMAAPAGRRIARTLACCVKAAVAGNSKESVVATKIVQNPKSQEDLMVQCCYSTFAMGDGETRKVFRSAKEAKVSVDLDKGGETVTVPACCRWQCCEQFFRVTAGGASGHVHEEGIADDESQDAGMDQTLTEAFAHCMESCPVDVRGAVVQNVVVVGGCASIRGFYPRLAIELKAGLLKNPKTAALADKLRFTPLDYAPASAAWAGAAIFGSVEGGADIGLTNQHYCEGKSLPDWAKDGFV